MSGLIEFSDGRWGLLGDDGFVDEFDTVEPAAPALETTAVLPPAHITVEPLTVTDTVCSTPADLPHFETPTVELLADIHERMREAGWGVGVIPSDHPVVHGAQLPQRHSPQEGQPPETS